MYIGWVQPGLRCLEEKVSRLCSGKRLCWEAMTLMSRLPNREETLLSPKALTFGGALQVLPVLEASLSPMLL